ncbi:succinyldiaminopimelate transaminase [Psychrobacter sp. FDAARGOS_221]|uniref:succinyldiaminopimelate transaminase n=1 Tax=Psychrobacter sp. FDAARGOS_221 TaxID=1975705 RepID=UPI000BB55308|nr:succinyldiaminopimelate transaminase [Psychrobacter sp. FDAARGOS_221]PNK60210.1 succinyldiaminopimelate transaminase [Psychrobacter sp. FDAARGOS_221]
MNPKLSLLHPYPFAKMATLLADSEAASDYDTIKLGIGEPKHQPPQFVLEVLANQLNKVQNYPSTNGMPELRESIASWLKQRFHLNSISTDSQIIPVMGTREALFSFVQAAIDPTLSNANTTELGLEKNGDESPLIVMPNPFYQIYEGAALLAGATPYFVPCTASNDFKGDYQSLPNDVWERAQIVFVCSPNNPTGAVFDLQDWQALIELSDRHDFIIASDECYSELYFDNPPMGLLQACAELGRDDYKNCVVFHSLSKRSNLPGLRSGFIAGDSALLKPYLQYRTYQGCALPLHHQLASIAAWQDEAHVEHNRQLYAQKFDLWMQQLGNQLKLRRPDAGFYLWVQVPDQFTDAQGDLDDEAFVKVLYEHLNIHALAGRYLSREVDGFNPGKGFVRLALVASVEESEQAIARIKTLFE